MQEEGTEGKLRYNKDSQRSARERLRNTDATVIMDAAKVASDELTA